MILLCLLLTRISIIVENEQHLRKKAMKYSNAGTLSSTESDAPRPSIPPSRYVNEEDPATINKCKQKRLKQIPDIPAIPPCVSMQSLYYT